MTVSRKSRTRAGWSTWAPYAFIAPFLALAPEELRDLAERGHVIASHTRTHVSASPGAVPGLQPVTLEREASASKQDLEVIVGRPVGALTWLEGAALGSNGAADRAVARAGYELLFANHAVQSVS